jgi:hypothetical protein
MRKLITILGVCVLFITLSFSGCELLEEEENYITVYIRVHCNVVLFNNQGEWVTAKDPINIPVRIQMIKDGGERFTFNIVTGTSGYTDPVDGNFKLYKEQRIEVTAETVSGFEDFYEYKAGFAMLTWAEVDAAADFGGLYSWSPTVIIEMRNSTR